MIYENLETGAKIRIPDNVKIPKESMFFKKYKVCDENIELPEIGIEQGVTNDVSN